MNLFETTILKKAGLEKEDAVAQVAMSRINIIKMSQTAEDAVLRPHDFGAFEHDLRAALAARVARLACDEMLASHYLASAGHYAAVADPAEPGRTHKLSTILTFVDKVSKQARNTEARDIAGLQAVGISDSDIVRLCELVAFLAYQIRVISGLRLMQGAIL